MKVKLLFFSLLLSSVVTQSQPLQNINKAKAYFEEHIQQLDPIEGVYDVENIVELYSAYAGWETIKQHFVCAILKNMQENGQEFFFVHSFGGDALGLIGGIEKMGGSRYYLFEKTDGNGNLEKIQFQLNDLFSFELKGNATSRTAKSRVTTKFVKKHPTMAMYAKQEKANEKKNAQWSGTGFALLEGYIVTNYHVVEDANNITVQGGNQFFSEKQEAIVIATDKTNDLAILKIKKDIETKDLPYSIKTITSEVGEEIWVLGYPLTSTMGDEIKLTTGVISAKSGYEGNTSMYQVSAPVQPGNSGGPLFDKKGNLIGIICAHHRDAENASYAIKASCLRNLIETSLDHDILPHTNKIASFDLANQVKSVKNFIYYITCKQ